MTAVQVAADICRGRPGGPEMQTTASSLLEEAPAPVSLFSRGLPDFIIASIVRDRAGPPFIGGCRKPAKACGLGH